MHFSHESLNLCCAFGAGELHAGNLIGGNRGKDPVSEIGHLSINAIVTRYSYIHVLQGNITRETRLSCRAAGFSNKVINQTYRSLFPMRQLQSTREGR